MTNRILPVTALLLLVGFLGWLVRRGATGTAPEPSAAPAVETHGRLAAGKPKALEERWVRRAQRAIAQPASEVVREKVGQFGKSRRELALKLAERKGVAMTPEIERFFAAVESGDWKQIEEAFNRINGNDSSASSNQARTPEVSAMWPAIIDAFGVAEQAHLLPAESLLDYGYSILDSLKPGMVYVGGTDSSRWVPALLNDTEEGERHIVITQNGLADSSYLDYVRMQFGEQMSALTDEESQATFQAYIEDAKRRLEHDQQFPDEPKQIRPGEEVSMNDGKMNVGGQVAVMDINERLLLKLLEKNPELSFAIGESFPLKKTYEDAVPLGHLMELRGNAAENFTESRAGESVEYWRSTMEAALAHPGTAQSESALKNYSHDASASANLLAEHGFHTEAEETYQLSRKVWPGNPEPVAHLAELYAKTGRSAKARALMEQFSRDFPAMQKPLREMTATINFQRSE